jgi:hypothetical protein
MDFTFDAYRTYLRLIKANYRHILTFSSFFAGSRSAASFCLIRHDVDRKPLNALRMATLEHQLGITATYFFRTKPHTLRPDIIKAISALGHEIGYHYENLSDCNGDSSAALADFEMNLSRLREIVPVETICMHGRPLKPWDNRELWRDPSRHALLQEKFGIRGEVYLDIDYSNIAYINDTGRNWSATKSNVRDRVKSTIRVDFANQSELLEYLRAPSHAKLVFQIHPERWACNMFDWGLQLGVDGLTNLAKRGFQSWRGLNGVG